VYLRNQAEPYLNVVALTPSEDDNELQYLKCSNNPLAGLSILLVDSWQPGARSSYHLKDSRQEQNACHGDVENRIMMTEVSMILYGKQALISDSKRARVLAWTARLVILTRLN
jgi:hypothetical protein